MKRIRTRIKDELDARGMTQKELADLTGIRPATINDLYHDRSKQFPRDVLEKIASALNIDHISEIIELVDDGQAE